VLFIGFLINPKFSFAMIIGLFFAITMFSFWIISPFPPANMPQTDKETYCFNKIVKSKYKSNVDKILRKEYNYLLQKFKQFWHKYGKKQ
jgi:hypothetical protein